MTAGQVRRGKGSCDRDCTGLAPALAARSTQVSTQAYLSLAHGASGRTVGGPTIPGELHVVLDLWLSADDLLVAHTLLHMAAPSANETLCVCLFLEWADLVTPEPLSTFVPAPTRARWLVHQLRVSCLRLRSGVQCLPTALEPAMDEASCRT